MYIGILGPFPSSVLAAGKETIKYFTLSNVIYEKTEAEEGEPGMYIYMYMYVNIYAYVYIYKKREISIYTYTYVCICIKYFTLSNVIYEKTEAEEGELGI
jgi:hypothetical protein